MQLRQLIKKYHVCYFYNCGIEIIVGFFNLAVFSILC